MKTRTIAALGAAAALAVTALLAPASAVADSASASSSDRTDDVVRDPGVTKSETSDLVKYSLELTANKVTWTWKFDNHRKGTVDGFYSAMALNGEDEFSVALDRSSARSAGVYIGDTKVCSVEQKKVFGKGGTLKVTADRTCLNNDGPRVTGIVSGIGTVSGGPSDDGWYDFAPSLTVWAEYPPFL